jgi:hypothetical protein
MYAPTSLNSCKAGCAGQALRPPWPDTIDIRAVGVRITRVKKSVAMARTGKETPRS